jgi:hypothetical protein
MIKLENIPNKINNSFFITNHIVVTRKTIPPIKTFSGNKLLVNTFDNSH